MKSNELDPIESGFGEDKIIVYLRRIWTEEEETYNQKFTELADLPDAKAREFEVIRDALGEFSVRVPEKFVLIEGQIKAVPVNDKPNPKEAIDEYFAVRTLVNDRVIRDIFWSFRRAQEPETRFLPRSAS